VTAAEMNAETSTGPATVRIRAVGPEDRSALHAVAVLHEELLPFGPLAALGADFLRVVCYQAPVRDGLLAVGLAEADGRPAGFVAYTADSERFHAEAMKRHVLLAGFQLVLALAKDPRRLKAVPRILRVLRSRVNDGEDRSDVGEVIGVGVRPEYLTPKFRKRTGRWLSKDLIGHAAEAVQATGKQKLRMFVAAENSRTLLLYQLLGAEFERLEHGGEPTVAVTFTLPFGGGSG
jgi:ribosomal protein S18 acetylase RimI-like enzyme